MLYLGLRRDGVLVHAKGWGRFLLRVAVATAVMAMLLSYFVPAQTVWLEASFWQTIGWLLLAVAGGGVAYLGVLFATGMRPAELALAPPTRNPG